MEYGNSCMGYEIPGGLGVKMADKSREVYVICGDASYLMLPSDIITTIQEGYKITIILINNEGYASIGGLSESVGGEGFGTHFKYRNPKTGQLDGDFLPVDLAKNAESLGAIVYKPKGIKEYIESLSKAKKNDRTTVIYMETIRDRKMSGYGYSWWEVPVPEISESTKVQKVREQYEIDKKSQKKYIKPSWINLSLMLTVITFVGFLAFVAIYSYSKLRNEELDSPQGYFLGGRSLTGIVIAGSMLLTNISTEHLIGLNGSSYKNGFIIIAWEVTSALALVVAAIYFVPRYLKMGLTTIPEFLERRFDKKI